jgi:hypothetical protein
MWTLEIIWKNLTTGKTTKKEPVISFPNRTAAEAHLINYTVDSENNHPTGYLMSPHKQFYVLDPHHYYMKTTINMEPV